MILRNNIWAALIMLIMSGLAFAQSKDPNNPTPVTSNTFEGKAGSEGGVFYYSYAAPKGTLKVTVTGQTNKYSSPVRFNVYNKVDGDSLGEIYVVAEDKPQTESKSYNFANKQTVIFSVSLRKDDTLKWQYYKVALGASSIIVIPGKKGLADLTVKEFNFVSGNDKAVTVEVANNGSIASGECKLELTVRKINGTAVGRTMSVDIPALNPGETKSITINAASILPKNVSLKDTTFKITADSASTVSESNETNNEKWHNLN